MTDTYQYAIARVMQDLKDSMPRCPRFKHITIETPSLKYGLVFKEKDEQPRKRKPRA